MVPSKNQTHSEESNLEGGMQGITPAAQNKPQPGQGAMPKTDSGASTPIGNNGLMKDRIGVKSTLEELALKKLHNPLIKELVLGTLAGFWIGISTIFAFTLAGGLPEELRHDYPTLPKIVIGVFFPVALWFIVLFGGELFTGNTMYLLLAFFARKVSLKETFLNWIVVFVSNAFGCIATVYLFGYLTKVFDKEPFLSFVTGIAEYKCQGDPSVAFARAIPANALVCTAIILGLQATDMTGKLISMWFPVMVFATIGYEHCIANLASVPMGIMYGAEATVSDFIVNNLLPVVCGNIIGGGFLIGGIEYYLFRLSTAAAVVEVIKAEIIRQQTADNVAASNREMPDGPTGTGTFIQGGSMQLGNEPVASPEEMTPEEIHANFRNAVNGPHSTIALSRTPMAGVADGSVAKITPTNAASTRMMTSGLNTGLMQRIGTLRRLDSQA